MHTDAPTPSDPRPKYEAQGDATLIDVLVHLVGEEPIVGQLQEVPDPFANAVVVHSPRQRDGKDLTNINSQVIEVVWPWWAIRYIEILPSTEEEKLITWVRE